ncbi:hypothetical protein CAPTEDRAFT_207884 [Capitella teleta]|uniref:Uncharacterized protein n=1 Tax=Capitella teleta TaxID=283909 RepID=R7V6J9_CAPTE|nr:hypothetical protein CAPTEDRAFT_207884 [Capitella teleta]|eukprot:ELU14164.1 hypothetical protein CAPTEDRAFT_207884 [Capitella teleta]
MKTQHRNISSPLEQDFAKCLVALNFCEDIVTRPANFAPPSKDANTETVTDHQSEIIMYITGAVLHKLKKRYARSNRSDDLDVIEGLISHKKRRARDHHSLRSIKREKMCNNEVVAEARVLLCHDENLHEVKYMEKGALERVGE